jgi:hypothetical protein
MVCSYPLPSIGGLPALHIFRIEPFLYRIISLSSDLSSGIMAPHWPSFTVDLLLRLITEKRASFFKTSVRHLIIDDMDNTVEPTSLSKIASACSGVKDIFLNISLSPMLPLLTSLSSLTRLGASLHPFFGSLPIDFTHPLFAHITHLEIFDYSETAQIAEGLSVIPNLTHCAFDDEVFLDKTQHILQTCSKLQYLIFVIVSVEELGMLEESDGKNDQCTALAEDTRFVVAVRSRFREDWRSGAQTGRDFWARAETFVALKREGKLNRKLRQIFTASHSSTRSRSRIPLQ